MPADHVFGTLLCLRRGPLPPDAAGRVAGHVAGETPSRPDPGEEKVIESLAALRPDRLLSSDLPRAAGTAERLAQRLDMPVALMPELRERCFGAWEGRSWAEIVTEDERALRFLEGFTTERPPGGETLEELRRRVLERVMAEMRRHHRKRVCMIGHAGPIRCLVAEAMGIEADPAQRLRLDPFGLTVIEWQGPIAEVRVVNHPLAGGSPLEPLGG